MEKRKLIKFGNYSLCITLPKDVISRLKLKKGETVDLAVNKANDQIIINLKSKKNPKAKTTAEAPSVKTRW